MAPRLRRVGFFREFGYATGDAPNLGEAVRAVEEYDTAAMARYLRAAPMLAASPGVVRDVLDPGASAIMTLSLKTDGVYEWPAALAYHVAKYRLALPADFVAHVAARGFRPPTREELDLPSG
jgi:hypothetical protein